MSIAPDALRADASWVRGFAEAIAETAWPAVGLAGSQVAAAIVAADPGLGALAEELRAWADTATAAAAELVSADLRADDGLLPR